MRIPQLPTGLSHLLDVTFTTGATVHLNEALLSTANNTYYTWTGSFADGGKVVPANSTPDSTGGIGPGKWLSAGDTTLRNDLKSSTGAAMIGTSSGKTVEHELNNLIGNRVVHAKDFPSIKAACEVLWPFNGGEVRLVDGDKVFAGEYNGITKFMDIQNISLVGAKIPIWNSDATKLIGDRLLKESSM